MSIFSQSKTSACPAFRPNRLPSWHTVISASDSHSCILCRSLLMKPEDVPKNASRAIRALREANPVFSIISFDPIGYFTRKCGRKGIHFWILVFACLTTGSINLIYTESLSTENITRAVHQHCIEYKFPSTIYVDKGSSCDIRRNQNIYKKYFNTEIEVVVCEKSHQMLNFAETSIRLIKKIFSSIFRQRSLKSLPNLTMLELTSLLAAVKNTANSKPIAGCASITPNHFLKNNWLIGGLEDKLNVIQLDFHSSLTHIIRAAGEAQETFINILKREWVMDPGHNKLGPGKNDKFEVNDIVLYLIQNPNQTKIARITKVHGPYSTILCSDGKNKTKYKNIHHRFLIFLFRPDFSNESPEVCKHSREEIAKQKHPGAKFEEPNISKQWRGADDAKQELHEGDSGSGSGSFCAALNPNNEQRAALSQRERPGPVSAGEPAYITMRLGLLIISLWEATPSSTSEEH